MRSRMFWDPPRLPKYDLVMPDMDWEGVAQLSERTARLDPGDGNSEELFESLQRHFRRVPFLRKIRPPEDDDDEVDFALFLSDGTGVMGWPGHYSALDEAWMHDPYWLLDALAGVDERTARAGEDFVRGFLSTRYTFVADLKAAQAAAPGRFELPPHGKVERPTIRGDARVDGDGLVRQVTWRQPFRRRPRMPAAKEPVMTIWHSMELWDFGVDAEIEVPALS